MSCLALDSASMGKAHQSIFYTPKLCKMPKPEDFFRLFSASDTYEDFLTAFQERQPDTNISSRPRRKRIPDSAWGDSKRWYVYTADRVEPFSMPAAILQFHMPYVSDVRRLGSGFDQALDGKVTKFQRYECQTAEVATAWMQQSSTSDQLRTLQAHSVSRLVDTWILADYALIHGLADACVDALWRKLDQPDWKLSLDDIWEIWGDPEGDSELSEDDNGAPQPIEWKIISFLLEACLILEPFGPSDILIEMLASADKTLTPQKKTARTPIFFPGPRNQCLPYGFLEAMKKRAKKISIATRSQREEAWKAALEDLDYRFHFEVRPEDEDTGL